MKNYKTHKWEYTSSLTNDDNTVTACGCMGPQNGEPLCPCMMRARGVYKKDGRWVEPEKDLGPILKAY